jgi:hypothetical protein
MEQPASVSWLRIAFVTLGLLATLPLGLMFGLPGVAVALVFVILGALAK